MTTEELEEILRLDAESTEDQESDTEILLYVMEVITKRRSNNGNTGNTAQEAYELFKQQYMPEIDNEDPIPANENKAKRITFCWVRVLAVTAAVFAIVIFSAITAKAFGFDVWETVIQWTQETFHFGTGNESPGEGNQLMYASFQEALEDDEVSVSLAPTWFPEGYILDNIAVEHNPLKNKYRAIYKNGEQALRITVHGYLDKIPMYVEQSEGLVEEYMVSGITYYLFQNNERTQAVWVVDLFECRITGELTIDELKMMIDSIEKG